MNYPWINEIRSKQKISPNKEIQAYTHLYTEVEIYIKIMSCEMERTTKSYAELGLVSNKEETSNIMLSTLGSFLSDPLLCCCLICISHFHNFIDLQLQAMHPHFTLPSALRPYVRSKYIHFIWYITTY